MRGRQPSVSDHGGLLGLPVKSSREPSGKAVDCERLKPDIKPRKSFRREIRPKGYTRNDKTDELACPQAGVQGHESHRVNADQPKHETSHEWHTTLSGQPEEQPAPKRPLASAKTSLARRIAGQAGEDWRAKGREQLKRTISGPIAIEPPPSIITPAFDAPISAVNAGERKVVVKYGQSTMLLPVTLLTTPLDILHIASQRSPGAISLGTMIVVESYKQLGLERPLRKYERVRDVLNSWDNDQQNTLLIVPSPTEGRDEDLELTCVPKSQPEDTSVSIYHSQRPGQWGKRWVTLRSDGQVLVAKKHGGETTNICHLSDFDIFVPTARQLSKKIKPPRKICFAVKSQQKSSMFMSTVNFIHFFSTNDQTLAASWYKAVQEWRSWYLVNVMGEGERLLSSPKKGLADTGQRGSIDSQAKMKYSGRPLIPGEGQNRTSAEDGPSQRMPIRNRDAPPLSFPKKLTKDAETGAPTSRKHDPSIIQRRSTEPDPFSVDSLLGRTYTQRQQSQQSNEGDRIAPGGPLPPMSLATDQCNGLKRAPSQRQKPKPLVDLTPQYREPPQHTRKGRGVVPAQMPAGGLIEIATSPEAAVETPPATIWQRPITRGKDSGNGSDPNMQRSRTMSRNHSNGPSRAPRQTSTSPEKGNEPFATGLLADYRRGQGGTGTGRGVATGDRQAKVPMLNVTEESKYAHGSLLERVDRYDGGTKASH